MLTMKSFVWGAVIASATLMSAPESLASPLVPVTPSVLPPLGPTRGQRAVMSAGEDFQAIAVGAIGEIQDTFGEANDAIGSISLSFDVHERALRIARMAIKEMKSQQKHGKKELKAAYKSAKRYVQDVGGTASDLEDLKARYENLQRYLNEYGNSFLSNIFQIADAVRF